VSGVLRLLLYEPPALFLHATLRGVEDQELTALLELGIPQHEVLTLIVIVNVFGGGFVGVDPLG
jgi:hypothetical protein